MATMKSKSHQHKKGKCWVYFKRTDSVNSKRQSDAAENAPKHSVNPPGRKKQRGKTKSEEFCEKPQDSQSTSEGKTSQAFEDSSKVSIGIDRQKESGPKDGSGSTQQKKRKRRRLKILKRKQKEGVNDATLDMDSSKSKKCKTKGIKLTKDSSDQGGESRPGITDCSNPVEAGDKAASDLISRTKAKRGKKRKHKASGGVSSGRGSEAKRGKRENPTLDSGMSSGTETSVFPSEPQDVAANWRALMSKLKGSGISNQKATSRKKKESDSGSNKAEIWFDDVDPALLEAEKLPSGGGEKSTDRDAGNADSDESKKEMTKCVALDCEMVGIGHDGKDSILARVSMVNEYGHCIYDKFVKPREKVTDYRTAVSGVRPSDLFRGKAEEFLTVQKEVADVLKDRILVGHALKNDMKVLYLGHPRSRVRDTATYPHFRELMKTKRPALRKLAKTVLGVTIQEGEHSSVEDARTAMRLYTLHRAAWERALKHKARSVTTKTKK